MIDTTPFTNKESLHVALLLFNIAADKGAEEINIIQALSHNGSNSNISSLMIVGFILSAKLQIKLGINKSFARKLRKPAISASFSFSYAIIQKINCTFAPASSRKAEVQDIVGILNIRIQF